MAKPRVSPNDVYVFWEYDQFPYMLGGKADMTKRRGSTYFVPSYGHWFRPFAVVDGIAGAQLKHDLEVMRSELRAEENKVRGDFNQRLIARLKKSKIYHPRHKD